MAESAQVNVEGGGGEWQRIQNLSGRVPPPRSMAASRVVGDELFVFGGASSTGNPLDDLWKYSFEDGTWEEVQVSSDIKPDKRYLSSFAVCNSSRTIYLFGGEVQGDDGTTYTYFNDFWKFDIRSKRWTCINERTTDQSAADQAIHGRIPCKRSAYVCTIHDGKFVLFGGRGDGRDLNELHVFDLEKNKWKEIKAQDGVWPSARFDAGCTKDARFLYVHGGRDGTGKKKGDFFTLDLETYTWKEMFPQGTVPHPRSAHTICLHGNRIFLHGGCFSFASPTRYSAGMYVYRIDSNQWTPENCDSNDAPSARGASAVHIHKNSIYLFGGFDGYDALNDFYRYRLNPISIPPAKLGRDIKSLVSNPKYADVCFIVEGKEVPANKSALATRSEYFDSILFGGMHEGAPTSKKPIEIRDVSHSTFLKVLEYLCSDELQCDSLEEAKQLLAASDMFQLDRLKALCENSIRQKLSKETVISILLVSHRHQATGLKQCAMDYLMQNWNDPIVKQRRFELQNEADLTFEILQHEDLTSR